MKAIKILSLIFLSATLMMSCSSDDDKMNASPQEMEAFAMQHFPNSKVIQTKEINYKGSRAFEIKLEGGIELKFDSNGKLIEIESETRIPDSLIPSKILDYVALHYPDNFIIEWELEDYKQEVKLDNGVELEFEREDLPEVDVSKMPAAIVSFINDHFPNTKVIKFVKVTKLNSISYDVKLSGLVDLEFNSKMGITEIESKTELPASVIPSKISDYVATNYPDNFIIEWELEDDHQEVKLDSGIELEFTMDGVFIKVD